MLFFGTQFVFAFVINIKQTTTKKYQGGHARSQEGEGNAGQDGK